MVFIGDRNEALLEEVRQTIGRDRCATAVIDVTRGDRSRAAGATDRQEFGKVDIAVNSAGIGTLGPIHDLPAENWSAVIDVCLTGVFHAVKHEAKAMLDQGNGGVIVNLASIYGRQPGEGMVGVLLREGGRRDADARRRARAGPSGRPCQCDRPWLCGDTDDCTDATEVSSGVPRRDPAWSSRVSPMTWHVLPLFLVGDDADWFNGETMVVDGGEVHREAPRLLTRDR